MIKITGTDDIYGIDCVIEIYLGLFRQKDKL